MSACRTLFSQRSLQSSSLHTGGRHAVRRTTVRPMAASPKAVNRTDLARALATKTGMKKSEAEEAVSALLDIIVEKVAAGERVTVVGFGTFEAKERSERLGRNPQTGQPIKIAARTVPSFSAGKNFKTAVDAKNHAGQEAAKN